MVEEERSLREACTWGLDGCSGSLLIADAGAGTCLASLGGAGYVLEELGALGVMQLGEPDALRGKREVCEEAKKNVEEWERRMFPTSSSSSTGAKKKKSQKPIELVFLFTDFLWEKEDFISAILGADFASSTWVRARVICSISPKSHGTLHGKPKQGLDFTAFGMKLQELAKPNAAEVRVEHREWNIVMHLTHSSFFSQQNLGIFTIANERLTKGFPVTRCRLGLFHKQDIEELDGNEDLSFTIKSDIKLLAHVLCGVLREQLNVSFMKSCWAAGFTSRLLGNVMLDFAQELDEVEARTGLKRNRRRATLLLVDRSVDLASVLCEEGDSLLQSMHNLLQSGAYAKGGQGMVLESKLGRLSLQHASDTKSNDLLTELCSLSPGEKQMSQVLGCQMSQSQVARCLESSFMQEQSYLERIPFLQVVAVCILALAHRDSRAQYIALERVVKMTAESDRAHVLLPLVDLLNKGNTPLSQVMQLALLVHALVGAMPDVTLDESLHESFRSSLTSALESADPQDPVWNFLAGSDTQHILRVLHETLTTEQNKNHYQDFAGQPLLANIVSRAFQGKHCVLSPLGESAIEQTAKELGNQAKQFLRSFVGFGASTSSTPSASSSPREDESPSTRRANKQNQQKLQLTDSDLCIIFVIGGISFSEVQAILHTAKRMGKTTTFLFGGTCIASPSQLIFRTFETK